MHAPSRGDQPPPRAHGAQQQQRDQRQQRPGLGFGDRRDVAALGSLPATASVSAWLSSTTAPLTAVTR